MPQEFKRGDRVEWTFRGHTVRGKVVRKLTKRTEIDGRIAAASKDDPRYVVRTERSSRQVAHRPQALRPAARGNRPAGARGALPGAEGDAVE